MKAARPRTPARAPPERAAALPAPAVAIGGTPVSVVGTAGRVTVPMEVVVGTTGAGAEVLLWYEGGGLAKWDRAC